MAFNLRMPSSASSLFHQLLLLGLEVRPGIAEDRSPAANIDADCARISFKEMPITPLFEAPPTVSGTTAQGKKCVSHTYLPKYSSKECEYAKFYSRSHDAVIRLYDESGNVIETHV